MKRLLLLGFLGLCCMALSIWQPASAQSTSFPNSGYQQFTPYQADGPAGRGEGTYSPDQEGFWDTVLNTVYTNTEDRRFVRATVIDKGVDAEGRPIYEYVVEYTTQNGTITGNTKRFRIRQLNRDNPNNSAYDIIEVQTPELPAPLLVFVSSAMAGCLSRCRSWRRLQRRRPATNLVQG